MKKDQILGLLRHVLTLAGGALIAKGIGDDAIVNETIGLLMSAAGLGWSWWEKTRR